MTWIYWFGLIILIFLFYFHFSNFKKLNEVYVYLTFILLIIYLIGTPIFHEHLPRFEDSWTHAFLAQEMFDNGRVINQISNYEQYPGAFLYFGFLFQILPSYHVMKFLPLVFYILGMIVVYILTKHLFNSKISFLASVLYIFFNWTPEDNHISPQFLMLYIYFLFMYILVKLLSEKNKNRKLFIVTSLFTVAIVFSHPITPIILILIMCSVFVLCKKFRMVLLPITAFLVISFIAYHVYQTTIFESYITLIKQFFEILLTGNGFSQTYVRFSTNVLSRQIFISSRFGITIVSMVLGILGLFFARKKGYGLGTNFFFAWTFSMIFFIIFQAFVFKGEFYERFVLISCFPLAAMGAYWLIESKAGMSIFVILLVISPLYFITKYGNEVFESESVEKLKGDCFYNHFDSDCEKRQEIVDSQVNSAIPKYFGKIDFTINREEIMAASVYLDKSLVDVFNLVDSYSSELRLDRIYSTNNAGVYR